MRIVSLWAAAFILSGSSPGWAAAGERDFRLIYARGWNFSVSIDLLGGLEKALSRDARTVKLEKIETVTAYYSQGHFLLGPAQGFEPGGAPEPSRARRREGETEVLETPIAALWASTGLPAGFLGEVYGYVREQDEDSADAPGARRATGTLWSMEGPDGRYQGLGLGRGTPERWSRTAAVRYLLRVDGSTVSVTAAGKPLGGQGRVRAALRALGAGEARPELRLSLGDIGVPSEFGLRKDALLELGAESGFDLVAFQPRDVELAWAELTAGSGTVRRIRPLCTNLKTAPSAPPPFQRVHVEEAGGLRVGVASLIPREAQAVFSRRGLPYEVEDPISAAKAAVRELRGRHKADLVVLVSHLKEEDEIRLLAEVDGVDVVLSGISHDVLARRKVTVELADWSRERHASPILRARAPRHGFGELTAFFRDAEAPELVRLEEVPFQGGPDMPEDPRQAELHESVLDYFIKPKEPLLPDPRRLWPGTARPKLVFDALEFWSLAARQVREETGAEIALLRIHPLGSNVTGELSDSYPAEWLSPDRPLTVVRLPGRALKALGGRVPPDQPPIVEGCCGPARRRYGSEVWLAASGLDRKGRVSGVPLSDNELYSVALTEDLLQSREELSALDSALDPRPAGRTLSESVLGSLKKKRSSLPAAEYEAEVRGASEGKSPVGLVWRLNLRELSIQFANTQVENNQGLGQVRDARVQAVSQVYTAGSARLFSELYWNRFRWDSGVSADYGRVTIKPTGSKAIINKTKDQLVLDTELRHRTWSLSASSLRPSVGPFVNVAYDTEFDKPAGRAKREFVRYKAGLKLFDGSFLKEAYVGGLAESDYSAGGSGSRYGYAAGLSLEAAIPRTPVLAKADASYVEFGRGARDTAADLKRRLDLSLRLGVPLLRELRLSPFVSYYLFEGAVVRATGSNLLFGFSLEYSHLWKPFF